jgi:hypothetical protein
MSIFRRACQVCFYLVVSVTIIFLIELILHTVTDFRALTGCATDVNMMFVCGDVPFRTLRQIVLSLPNVFMLAPIVLYAQAFLIGLAITPGAFALLMAANVILLFAAVHLLRQIGRLLGIVRSAGP